VADLLHAHRVSSLSLSWLALGGWLAGWLPRWLAQLLLLVGWLAIGLASCSWLAAWLAACCVADEADEADINI